MSVERPIRAWRTWLESFAHDAEAAQLASLTYQALDSKGREAWLLALELDASTLTIPAIALYAPLLAVEDDAERRQHIAQQILSSSQMNQKFSRGLRRYNPSTQVRQLLFMNPLYLDFVELLCCELNEFGAFNSIEHVPFYEIQQLSEPDGFECEEVPVQPLIEELACAVLAHRRLHGCLPEGSHLFEKCFALIFSKEELIGQKKVV